MFHVHIMLVKGLQTSLLHNTQSPDTAWPASWLLDRALLLRANGMNERVALPQPGRLSIVPGWRAKSILRRTSPKSNAQRVLCHSDPFGAVTFDRGFLPARDPLHRSAEPLLQLGLPSPDLNRPIYCSRIT
jgi:hypothetical protein